MLIDSHAHLEMPQFEPDLPQVLERAQGAGVSRIITIGSDLPSCRKAVQLAEDYPFIYAALGIHPHEAKSATPQTWQSLAELAQSPKVLAIGESGLDYYYRHSPTDAQRRAFLSQIELANRLELPLIVHSRQADSDIVSILKENPVQKKGVIHCFSGDEKMLEECLKLGFYISLSGIVTFPKAQVLQELVKLIPGERLLLETDCPYLAPAPWRGKRNEPAYLPAIAQKVAELKGLSVQDIARITTLNVHQLLGLNGADTQGKIAYPIRNSLYLNLTNRCTNRCTFCARRKSYYVQGHNLQLGQEPGVEEILAALPDLTPYKEVVFCGLGEPFLRLEELLAVARHLKAQGMRVRVNSNGQGNLIYGRNIVSELAGLVDALSVSLNTADNLQYQQICQSRYGEVAYLAVLEFIRAAVHAGIQVTATALDLPEVDLDACTQLARQLGVSLRVRHYNLVG